MLDSQRAEQTITPDFLERALQKARETLNGCVFRTHLVLLQLIYAVPNLHHLSYRPLSNFVSPGAIEMQKSTVAYADHLYPIAFLLKMILKFRGYSTNVESLPK